MRRYYATHPEYRKHLREQEAKRRQENPEQRRKHDAAYRERNAEQVRKRRREWQKQHPESVEASNANRRARKMRAQGTHTQAEVVELFRDHAGLCVYCLAPATTVDHVEPLANGGSNRVENLAPCCAACNSSKCDQGLLVWLARGGRLTRAA
jgi:hypothetical protein